jgi:hypothetical protein
MGMYVEDPVGRSVGSLGLSVGDLVGDFGRE